MSAPGFRPTVSDSKQLRSAGAAPTAFAPEVITCSLVEGSPFHSEGLGVGAAVVTPDVCGIPEILRHGSTGLFVLRGNVAKSERHLRELMANPVLRAPLCGKACGFADIRLVAVTVAASLRGDK